MLPILFFSALIACERLPDRAEREVVIARVDGEPLTKTEFERFVPEDYQDVLTSEEKQEYLERWVTTELLYREALRSGRGMNDELEARLEQYKKDLIADQLVQQVIQEKAVVSEDEMIAYWEAHKHEYLTEYRVSHILVNTLEDAEEVKSQLDKRSFESLARKYSIDKHARYAGDLGYLSKGNMIPEFEAIIFKMHVEEVSDIVESEFGYHLIKVTDIRDARVKVSYEDVRNEIANILTMKKREAVYDSLITDLRAQARIELSEGALGWVGVSEPDTVITHQYQSVVEE